MKAKDLIAAIRDEVDRKHQWNNSYGGEVEEIPIKDIMRPENGLTGEINGKAHLRAIHIPITRAVDLTDDERHKLLSRVFDRKITSAKEITNVEAQAFGAITQVLDSDELAEACKEIIS